MKTFQIELSPSVPSSGTPFTGGDKVSGTVVLTSSKDEAVGTVEIIFRGRTKSRVTIKRYDSKGQPSHTTYRGRATLFEFTEPLHRGYPGHFTLPAERHEWPFEFTFPDTALPGFRATPWTESENYAHRPGHTLPPSFSTKHDGGHHQKDNYICYELEAVLTPPASTFSILKLPLKCRVDLPFSPSRVVDDPDPDMYCKEQTFTRRSRRLDPSTAGGSLNLKEKARALWAHEEQPKATFAIKVEIPQVGYISGPLDIFVGVVHDRGNSASTALSLVYLKRVRVRLLATTYIRCQHTSIFGHQEEGKVFNTNFDVLDHSFSETPMAEHMNMMQLCPALQLGRHLTPTFSTYNLAREYRLEVKVTVECAQKTFKAEFGGCWFLVLPEVFRSPGSPDERPTTRQHDRI